MNAGTKSIVESWCAEQNRASKAWWHAAGAVAVAACSVWLWVLDVRPYGPPLLGVLIAFLAWLILSPRVLIQSCLYPNEYLQDELLSRIASSEEVPVAMKADLARRAVDRGYVTFGDLAKAAHRLDLDGYAAARQAGDGFQALRGFHPDGPTQAAPD